MQFYGVNTFHQLPKANAAALFRESWNDWWKYQTLFSLVVYGPDAQPRGIGRVKIARVGHTHVAGGPIVTTELPDQFEFLDTEFYSLGQSENYYESLNELDETTRDAVLSALRDVAYNPAILESVRGEDAFGESLTRDIPLNVIEGRYHRLARGNAALTRFRFGFALDDTPMPHSPRMEFSVQPSSSPPTNIHAIIGRNGVGKTRCLQNMAQILSGAAVPPQAGSFFSADGHAFEVPFANMVSVSFSAFDHYFWPTQQNRLRYAHVGLTKVTPSMEAGAQVAVLAVETPSSLASVFVDSAIQCRVGARRGRWRRALETLESDALFADAGLSATARGEFDEAALRTHLQAVYARLSSGHKIVLLTMTRLVETVEEKTLVLLDEPEAHLHPPLLAAFIRALSELLIARNGVAIVATHSPVVLQEIPRSCGWIVRRAGRTTRVDRPAIETFGENIGILTSEVFGLEVSEAGFHKVIRDAAASGESYEEILARFDQQLGAEARAIALGLATMRRRS